MNVAQLELERTLDQAAILDLNTSIVDLNLERTLTRADIETLNLSIAKHAIIGDMLNDSLTELLVYFGIQIEEMNAQNLSLVQITQDVETNKNSLRNISDDISVLNADVVMNKNSLRNISGVYQSSMQKVKQLMLQLKLTARCFCILVLA